MVWGEVVFYQLERINITTLCFEMGKGTLDEFMLIIIIIIVIIIISEVLLGANIHKPDAPLASQEREESEN